MSDWDSIYLPPMESLTGVGILPTWEKVVTYLPEPPDFGNLRDGHEPVTAPTAYPDLQDSSTLFWAHPGMPEMWQVTQGC